MTYSLDLYLNPLFIILYYYIIFRQSLVSLFDIVICYRLRGTGTVAMPSMTDCNHERLPMGDIQCKLSEQLGLVLLSS